MSPILVSGELPAGPEWIYQLKWDGFRVLASVSGGEVRLWSKSMSDKTAVYPEIAAAIVEKPAEDDFIIDGEAVVLDPSTGKPSFQRMQQRDKLNDPAAIRRAMKTHPIQWIMFDLLRYKGQDLRQLPFEERHQLLSGLVREWSPPCYLAEIYHDAESLWEWVRLNRFEGIIAKRLDSPYAAGKEHSDWFKRKTVFRAEAEIVGILIKDGRISSLAMRKDGRYYGRISSGLGDASKQALAGLSAEGRMEDYFEEMPDGLRRAKVLWLSRPLEAVVTGREVTENGLLRHPKLLSIKGVPI